MSDTQGRSPFASVPVSCQLVIALGLGFCTPFAQCQSRLERVDDNSISPADRVLLDDSDSPNTLRCAVSRVKPELEIDLLFHSGYAATIPLKSLAGQSGVLRTFVRVTPVRQPAHPVVFSTTLPLPAIEPKAKGDLELDGEYVVGRGQYQVDWTLRSGERTCAAHWQIEAKSGGALNQTTLAIGSDAVDEVPSDPFYDSGFRPRGSHDAQYVKLLVNFTPARLNMLTADDVRGITAILRAIAREPRLGRFSVVVFSAEQQRVLYRNNPDTRIDLPAIGRAVRDLRSGTIDIRQMEDPKSGARFLTRLLTEELGPQRPLPDAVIVISPRVSLKNGPSKEEMARQIHLQCPVFFLNYNPDPIANPWRGALGNVLRSAYHALAYTIARPRDLGSALRDIRSRMESHQ